MPSKTKKSRAAGRFGARYGKKVRARVVQVEDKQHLKQKCPHCKYSGVKRLSKGIWLCPKCKTKFAGDVYFLTK